MKYEQAAVDFISALKSTNKSKLMGNMNQYSKGENSVLAHLYHHDNEAIVPSDLSKCTHTSTARVATILNSLEEKGFITREIDKCDRRKILVRITDEGVEQAKKSKQQVLGNLAGIFEQMGEKDTQDFIRTFSKFVELGTSINCNGGED